jgi:hypothetical protein
LGGRKVVSLQRILRERIIDTVSRQQACVKTSRPKLLSTHISSKRLNNPAEKRDPAPTIHTAYQKLIEWERWDVKNKIDNSSNPCLPKRTEEE